MTGDCLPRSFKPSGMRGLLSWTRTRMRQAARRVEGKLQRNMHGCTTKYRRCACSGGHILNCPAPDLLGDLRLHQRELLDQPLAFSYAQGQESAMENGMHTRSIARSVSLHRSTQMLWTSQSPSAIMARHPPDLRLWSRYIPAFLDTPELIGPTSDYFLLSTHGD